MVLRFTVRTWCGSSWRWSSSCGDLAGWACCRFWLSDLSTAPASLQSQFRSLPPPLRPLPALHPVLVCMEVPAQVSDSLCLPISPMWGAGVCSVTSLFWMIKKSCKFFSLFSFSLVVRMQWRPPSSSCPGRGRRSPPHHFIFTVTSQEDRYYYLIVEDKEVSVLPNILRTVVPGPGSRQPDPGVTSKLSLLIRKQR